jgi:hypothetical protein
MSEKVSKPKDSDAKYKYAVLLLIGILLVVSVVQAYQINEVKEDIITGQLAAVSAGTQRTSSASTQSAPTMVGGC